MTTQVIGDKLGEVLEADATAHTTFNTAIRWMRALVPGTVKSMTITTPPGSPSNDDLYVVGAGGTGDWLGEDGSLALYNDDDWGTNGWDFMLPTDGLRIWDTGVTPEVLRIYDADGSAWRVVYTSTS
jgi:hypothetical protein